MEDKLLPSTYIRIKYYPLLIDTSTFFGVLILTFVCVAVANKIVKYLHDNLSHK